MDSQPLNSSPLIPMVSIVGKSGCGKTTLLEKLIPALRGFGLRIATIKHDAHSFEMDTPGKDTWRHKQAGAEAVLISSAKKLALIQDAAIDRPPRDLQQQYLRDVDLILTEGYRTGNLPKIEVHRRARSAKLLCISDDNLLAIASDEPLNVSVPCFDLNDVCGLAKFLRDYVEEFCQAAEPLSAVELYLDGQPLRLKPFMEQLIADLLDAVLMNLKHDGYHRALQLVVRKRT